MPIPMLMLRGKKRSPRHLHRSFQPGRFDDPVKRQSMRRMLAAIRPFLIVAPFRGQTPSGRIDPSESSRISSHLMTPISFMVRAQNSLLASHSFMVSALFL